MLAGASCFRVRTGLERLNNGGGSVASPSSGGVFTSWPLAEGAVSWADPAVRSDPYCYRVSLSLSLSLSQDSTKVEHLV